jgi:hypothetical protein
MARSGSVAKNIFIESGGQLKKGDLADYGLK